MTSNLSQASSRGRLTEICRAAHVDEPCNLVMRQRIGQLARSVRELLETIMTKD
jgi:hypothetical protein